MLLTGIAKASETSGLHLHLPGCFTFRLLFFYILILYWPDRGLRPGTNAGILPVSAHIHPSP